MTQPPRNPAPPPASSHAPSFAPPFNFNLLRSLDTLLETRNLTAAAKRLGTTQSALSRQLAQLRIELGDPLLVREGQRYLLTERALALREPLRAALEGMEGLLAAPRFDPASCTRTFSMSGSDYIADHMLPALMRALAAQAPRLRVAFRMWEAGHYRLLAEEGVDLVPTIADALPDNLHGRAMGEDKPVCLMRSTHRLAGANMSVEDYVGAAHIAIGSGGDKSGPVDQHLAALGLRREVRVAVPFYSSALRLVADPEHDFLLTVPQHIAVALAREAPVVWQALPFDVHSYRYWLLWHARSHHDPAHQWFRNHVYDVLQQSIHGVTRFNET
ncbi:MAG: LysR family transcriptional regulator [Pseudomonadota bacterium]